MGKHGYHIYEFYMEASNDGIEWEKIEGDTIHAEVPTGYHAGQFSYGYYVELENKNPYKYYRVYFPKGGWT